MRWIFSVALLAFAASAAAQEPKIQVLMSTSAGIAIAAWCNLDRCENRQAVANMADAHCRTFGRSARLADGQLVERDMFTNQGRWSYRFNCVR